MDTLPMVVSLAHGHESPEYARLVLHQTVALNNVMNAVAKEFATLLAPIAVAFLETKGAHSSKKAIHISDVAKHIDDWFNQKASMPGFGSAMTIQNILPDGTFLPFSQLISEHRVGKAGSTFSDSRDQIAMDILIHHLSRSNYNLSTIIRLEDKKIWVERREK